MTKVRREALVECSLQIKMKKPTLLHSFARTREEIKDSICNIS
jgi:hypothetical protein